MIQLITMKQLSFTKCGIISLFFERNIFILFSNDDATYALSNKKISKKLVEIWNFSFIIVSNDLHLLLNFKVMESLGYPSLQCVNSMLFYIIERDISWELMKINDLLRIWQFSFKTKWCPEQQLHLEMTLRTKNIWWIIISIIAFVCAIVILFLKI